MSDAIAIIGDRFMLPSVFADRIAAACGGNGVSIRTLEQPWPDQPMEHGYADATLDRLKEFMGDPDEIAAFIGDAAMFVTHLAPVSRAMLERLPNLKFIAVSRGGPVNIDVQAARDHGVVVVNTPGRNASAVAEFTIGAILAETRLIRTGHEALRAGERRVMAKGDAREHRVRQLARLFGLDPPPAPVLWTGPGHDRAAEALLPPGPSVLAIGPAANWRGKQWRAERFAELAQRLPAADGPLPGARIAVLAAAHERAQAAALLSAMPPGEVIDLTNETRTVTRVIIDANPQSRGQFAVYGS
jgi:hypothetical protein